MMSSGIAFTISIAPRTIARPAPATRRGPRRPYDVVARPR
ncbi:hypothetical protein HMPREF9062_2025 [Actinomyces sp. oral taxon 448 str. F0400]|nr:hypothetical protein HMPREF9062_2025 [Actinomyces sp. oral taxon 448 str. F0400]